LYLPEEFENRMKSYLGNEYDEFIASYDKPEVKGLRINKEAPGNILGAICDETEGAGSEIFDTVPWISNGYSYISGTVFPGKHPYHEAGVYYIQEPSAMAPAVYLDARPGDRVLDLCAAPGGKSTQIAFMLKGEGILISNEIMPDRARILSENIERMGVKNALVISEDPRNISDRFTGYFDKILVDAPCSGEGMFRRSETAVEEWSPENVNMCANRQAWILDEAAKMLRPGGRLVYSTCTFSKEEDENTILSFLERNDEFEPEEMKVYGKMRPGFDGVGIRLWPHLVDGEGHFVCALKKKSSIDVEENEKVIKVMPPCGYEYGINKKEMADLKDMNDFFKNNILDKNFLAGKTFVKFKEQIYMIPDECPSLTGLKVLRPGLHLGELKKKRFEPAHALSRVFKPEEVENSCDLSCKSDEILKYINGETYNISLPNGWYVNFVDKNPIGWGKISNEIMKNHYPKGLRKKIM